MDRERIMFFVLADLLHDMGKLLVRGGGTIFPRPDIYSNAGTARTRPQRDYHNP